METSSLETKAARFPTFKRLFCWRNVRFALIGLASLITLFALFHAEENWRGKRAWTKYRAAMEAKGAIFDLKALIPPPVPDELNFAMTPLLKPVLDLYTRAESAAKQPESRFKDTNGFNRVNAVQLVHAGHVSAEYPRQVWELGQRIDLIAWQDYFHGATNVPSWPEPRTPAEDVLKALSRFDAELAELREASRRPHARFNVAYEEENSYDILLPHAAVLKGMTRVVCLRATTELALGDADGALADVMLALKLSGSIKEEPILVSHLVRIATLQISLQTVWEGLQDHRWSDAQLRQLEARLVAVDLLAEGARALRGERAFGNRAIEWLRQNPARLEQLGDAPSDVPPKVAYRLLPRGWFYFEQLNYNRLFDEFILARLSSDATGFDIVKAREKAEEMHGVLARLSSARRAFFEHYVLSRLLLPAINRVLQRSIAAQTMTKLAIVALALERHRFAHGSYPGSLAALSPEFLASVPVDPITRKPLHYRHTDDGRFVLYSVGWNQVDDGGKFAFHGTKQRDIDFEKGDWVWPTPESEKVGK